MNYKNLCVPSAFSASLRFKSLKLRKDIATLQLNQISGIIVDAGLKVHSKLGPGLLESAYEACLKHELRKAGLATVSRISG